VISTAPPPLSGPMTTPNAPPTFQPSFTAPSAAPAFTAPSAAPAFAAPATPAPARSWRGIALAAGAISIAALGVVAGVRYFGSDADDVEDATPPAQAPAAPAMPQAPPPPPPLMYAPPAVGMPAAPVAATAPAAPSAPPGGISIDDVHAIGPLTGATREAVERAIPQMLQCRRPGQVQHVEALAIINEGGSVPIARYGNDNPGDTETANCVAHAFQASAPVPIHGNGILSWTVTLGPR
jgi:hypothetical protein